MGAWRLAVLILLAGCAGPAPKVISVAASPSPAGTRVVVEILNEGSGEGEVQVTVRLRGGEKVVEKEERLSLGPHQKKQVATEIPVPPDGYVAEADVEYPVK